MLQKGIVEQVIDKNTLKVRVPTYDKAKTASGATPTEELSKAIICSAPGIKTNFTIDDVVYVCYENDLIEQPVVLGVLQRATPGQSNIDIEATSLIVDVNTSLPSNTTIGEITPEEIYNLKGTTGNIQGQINLVRDVLVRQNFEIIMSLYNKDVTFNEDGSITEVATIDDEDYYTKDIVFNDDGSITETVINGSIVYYKTTVFNDDGSIKEYVVRQV